MSNVNSYLLSRKYTAHCSSCMVVELWKINGKIVRIEGDVHNCADYWRIFMWSPTTYAWNVIFSTEDVPGLKHVDYHQCTVENKDYGYLPNSTVIENISILKEYAEKFIEALED